MYEDIVKNDTDLAKLESDINEVWSRMKAAQVEFDVMKANSLLQCCQLRFDLIRGMRIYHE